MEERPVDAIKNLLGAYDAIKDEALRDAGYSITSIVRQNAEREPNYAPYCLRCNTIRRMTKVEQFFWRCSQCGAEHDERTDTNQ
jgi:Zn finger protein HypA/HybF involved in hydrogenase expression